MKEDINRRKDKVYCLINDSASTHLNPHTELAEIQFDKNPK